MAISKQAELQMVYTLERLGYVVRHESEAFRQISWSRTLPLPAGVNFKAEAVEKIKEQLTEQHLQFIEIPAETPSPLGILLAPGIMRARLMVMP